MNRGEVWTLQDDNYAHKARPVIILQDKLADTFDSVILCLLTSYNSEGITTRVRIEPSETNGLRKTSYVMTEKLLTVRKTELGKRIGKLTDDQVRSIAKQLASLLGITKDDLADNEGHTAL